MNHSDIDPTTKPPSGPITTVISCDSCMLRQSAACADCLVTHVLQLDQRSTMDFTDVELRAVQLLAQAGMVPSLRHREAA